MFGRKDFNRFLICIQYKSGAKNAMWVTRFSIDRSGRSSNYQWNEAACPFSETRNIDRLRELASTVAQRLDAANVLMCESVLQMNVDDISSVWTVCHVEGKDGQEPEPK